MTAWPHAPTHRLSETGTFIVTAGTLGKVHHFRTADRLDVLQRALLQEAARAGWRVEAWAVFSNHYHFVAHSPDDVASAADLSHWLGELHAATAGWVNRLDAAVGRQVWYNFWETRLTYRGAYLARLNYVHPNAVKHRLVRVANQYLWCSAAWFERSVSSAKLRTIYSVKTDRVRVLDDFAPVVE